MPFTLNKDRNLIMRAIVPLVSQPALSADGTPTFGMSDLMTSMFISPSKGSIIWGVRPVVSLPSSAEATLGTQKWSGGPTAVVLKQFGPMTAGMLWNQTWSFTGSSARKDTSKMFMQPFWAYSSKGGHLHHYQRIDGRLEGREGQVDHPGQLPPRQDVDVRDLSDELPGRHDLLGRGRCLRGGRVFNPA